jgi:flagellar biosynthesis protein FlhA
VLEQLLRERVSIRDMGAILEALLEAAPVNKNLVALVEAARQALGRRLIQPLLDGEASCRCCCSTRRSKRRSTLATESGGGQRLLAAAGLPADSAGPPPRRFCETTYRFGLRRGPSRAPCPSPARYHVKRWLEPVLPRLAVVAAGEIPAGNPAAAGGNGALRNGWRRVASGRIWF